MILESLIPLELSDGICISNHNDGPRQLDGPPTPTQVYTTISITTEQFVYAFVAGQGPDLGTGQPGPSESGRARVTWRTEPDPNDPTGQRHVCTRGPFEVLP